MEPTARAKAPIPALAGKIRGPSSCQALKDYKSGKRDNADHEGVRDRTLSDQDMANVAAYYASLKEVTCPPAHA